MSSGNVYERVFKLLASIYKMVLDGVRDLGAVCDALQAIVDGGCKPDDTQRQLADWRVFYARYFGITLDVSSIPIPERRSGFNRLLVVAQGLTPNQVFGVCQNHFPCGEKYGMDLDAATSGGDEREATQTYAIWVRDRQEADEELRNLSADDLRQNQTPTETLLERLLHELKYWSETGQHLDVGSWTLCAGSRDSGGGVPSVYWFDSVLQVDWDYSGRRHDQLRSRAAVPCQPFGWRRYGFLNS